MSNADQLEKIRNADGFIAALDQSGGSTPKALKLYGVDESEYSGDAEMFDLVHAMRTRIITSPSFGGDRILGAILFEMTMDREIGGMGSAEYLWKEKNVVPFLKVDKGMEAEENGAQVMKPMPELAALLERAKSHGVFGTKMRSVDINSPQKKEAEDLLKARILHKLDNIGDRKVMLKLTLPEVDNHYKACIDHPNVLRVVALSGGYSRDEANERLARQNGMVASFSRALSEGLNAKQTEEEFDAMLNDSIQAIFDASKT
ncbi:MAG: beta/alpha barrel domain-containing protein [Planctomycetota bacterium]|jgi:fructose-bisphosphate aldolase class I